MASNLIEIVIKAITEGGADVAALKDTLESLDKAGANGAKGIDAASKAVDALNGNIANFSGISNELADSLAKIKEVRAALEGKTDTESVQQLKELDALEGVFVDLQSRASLVEKALDSLSKTENESGLSAEKYAKAQELVSEALKQGITNAKEFDQFLANQSTKTAFGSTKKISSFGPTEIAARDMFAKVTTAVDSTATDKTRELNEELAKTPEIAKEAEGALADTARIAAEELTKAKLDVAELDAEISKLSATLSGVGIDIPTGELRKFAVDTAKTEGVSEAAVTGVMAELAKSIQGLSQDDLEKLTRGVIEASKSFKTDFIPTAQEAAKVINGTSDSIKDTTIEIGKFAAPTDRIDALIGKFTELNVKVKDTGDVFQDSAADSKAASDAMEGAGEVGAKSFNAARLSVQELDAELKNLSATLAATGNPNLDIPQGELRKFTVDTAKEKGVGEGVVTSVMGELASSIQGLTKDDLEALTRGVINASQTFKTDFIATAQEAARVVNGLGDTIKDTTVSIDGLVKPEGRAATLAGELNKNFKETGDGANKLGDQAQESGKGIDALNTAMTSLGTITTGLTPKLGQLQHLIAGFSLAKAAPAIAIAGLAAGFFALAKEAANTGSELKKTATINGLTVETLSSLKIAAEQNESSLGELSIGLRTLNRELASAVTQGGAAQKKFLDLGLTNEQLATFYTDSEGALEAVAKRITEAGSATEKTRLAISFFGRAGRELIPLLKEISDKGLAGLRQEAEKAGLVISNETAVAAKTFNDNLTSLGQTVQGFVFRSMTPFLAVFNQFVAESPGVVKAIGAIALALGGLTLALGVIKVLVSLLSGLKAAFAAGGLIATHPFIAGAVAITAVGAALFSLSKQSSETGESLDDLQEHTEKAVQKLTELEEKGYGASKAARDLREEIIKIAQASKEAEDRLTGLNKQIKDIQDRRKAGTLGNNQLQIDVENAKEVELQDQANQISPKKKNLEQFATPSQETEQAIAIIVKQLNNLTNAGLGAGKTAEELRDQLDALNKALVGEIDVEIAVLSKQLEGLRLEGTDAAGAIAALLLKLEALEKRREKGIKFTGLSDAGKQLQEQVENLRSEFSKTVAQTEIQTATQLLQQGGNVEEFFNNVNKQITAVRKAAQAPIEIQFKKEKETSGTGPEAKKVTEDAKAERERTADFQAVQQRRDALQKIADLETKRAADLVAATEARTKAEESLADAKLETQKQTLELSLAQIPTLDEAISRGAELGAQQKANLEIAIQNNVIRLKDLDRDKQDLEGIAEQAAELQKKKNEYIGITTEIEKQRAQLKTLGQLEVEIRKKFNDLTVKLDLQIDTTKAETEIDTLQDQLKKLELAKDLGADVSLNEFLDIAHKLDAAQQRILDNKIKGLEVDKKDLEFQLQKLEGLSAEQAASDKRVIDAQATIDKLKNQAVISATANADKALEDLARKSRDVAKDMADTFVDNLLDGLENKKFDFTKFFQNIGKSILTDLLKSSLTNALSPIIQKNAQAIGEEPAKTPGGQFLQEAKFLFGSIFGFDKKKEPIAAKADPQEQAAKSLQTGGASIKDAATTLTGSGNVLHTAGEWLLDAARALLGIQSKPTRDIVAPVQAEPPTDFNSALKQELEYINARMISANERLASKQAELSNANNDELKTALDEHISQLGDELKSLDTEKKVILDSPELKQAALAIKTDSNTSSKAIEQSSSQSLLNHTESASVLKMSANEVSVAARQLQQCYCGGGSKPVGGGGSPMSVAAPIIKVEAPKETEAVGRIVSVEIENPALKVLVGEPVEVQSPELKQVAAATGELADLGSGGVKIAGRDSTPAPSDDPLDEFFSRLRGDTSTASPTVAGSSNASSGSGILDSLGSFLPGAASLATGFGALASPNSGGALGVLTKVQGGLGAAKGAIEIWQALQKMLGGGGNWSAATTGGGFDAWDAGGFGGAASGLAGGAAEGGGFLDGIGGALSTGWDFLKNLWPFAKGGLIPESVRTSPMAIAMNGIPRLKFAAGGEIPIFATPGEYIMPVQTVQKLGVKKMDEIRAYAKGGIVQGGASAQAMLGPVSMPTPLGNVVTSGTIRQMRTADRTTNQSTLSQGGEADSAEMAARMKSIGERASSNDVLEQNVYIVDQRRPNLGPNDVEMIIADSMDRDRIVGKSVKNSIKRHRKG